MSAFKPQQRHLTIHGRVYHFVSYEGEPANKHHDQPARPAMWYLMAEGRRYPAVPSDPTQSEPEVDRALARWAVANTQGPVEPPPRPAAAKDHPPAKRPRNWWGPN
jgi:hypothetical protein